jgi:hypothetical protein
MTMVDLGIRQFRLNPPKFAIDVSAFCESLAVTLQNLQTEYAEFSYARTRLEEEDDADSTSSDAFLRSDSLLSHKGVEQPNSKDDGGDLIMFARKRIARCGLRSARYSKHQQSAKEIKAKRSKILAKMQKRLGAKSGSSVVLISELESMKLKTEAYAEQMRALLQEFEEASATLTRAYARRDALITGKDCLADVLRVSEVWEELSIERLESDEFLTECMMEASALQFAIGKIPIDDETLEAKLEILAAETTRIIDELFADPEAAKTDELIQEIDRLKADNRGIQQSIDSMLQTT